MRFAWSAFHWETDPSISCVYLVDPCGSLFSYLLQELASLRTAEFNLDISRGQIKRDVVEQVDGQLESAIRELQQQSKQECDLFKLELNAAFEDKVRGGWRV